MRGGVRVNLADECRSDADSPYDSLVEETLLPSQLERRIRLNSPSKRLWFGVLLDALSALDSASSRRRLEAREWIEADSIAWSGFRWTCDLFGLDANAVRGAVLRRAAR
jgi:hypothetical protein